MNTLTGYLDSAHLAASIIPKQPYWEKYSEEECLAVQAVIDRYDVAHENKQAAKSLLAEGFSND